MIKRDISQLTVYSIEEETETLPLGCLRRLYLEKTSEIIYVTKEGKLYGIICMGEVLYGHKQNAEVRINRNFTFLTGYNVIKAHDFFAKKKRVNKIPVVNEQMELIGDYSRWDDKLYIERNQAQIMQEKFVKKLLDPYETVYIVKPVESGDFNYLQLMEYLNCFHIDYVTLDKEQFGEKLFENAICILLNEDERTGLECLYGIEPRLHDYFGNDIRRYNILENEQYKMILITYKNLLLQILEMIQFENLGIVNPIDLAGRRHVNWFCNEANDKAATLLSSLEKRGIKCFSLYTYEYEKTEYGINFYNEIAERLDMRSQEIKESGWIGEIINEEFYDEIYQQEEFKSGKAQRTMAYFSNVFEYKKNITGRHFNARDGRRMTCYQPQEYIGTIYLLGVCWAIGPYVEDQYTIASYLQKRVLEKGYPYRVENCGLMSRWDAGIDARLTEIGTFSENDIILYQSPRWVVPGIQNFSIEKIYESHDIPSTWTVNNYMHCNHKVYKIMADSLLEIFEPYLSDKGNSRLVHINLHKVMEDYIRRKYLSRYFGDEKSGTVGAIVMSCNPFHRGHRYLIECAREKVDFLIIFVIDDDDFMFSFEERFKMIVEGTQDMNNVMVVPNGDFVCSRSNFLEYYTQDHYMTTHLILNAEYDINLFADYIAALLHITHRFAGAEPEGKVKEIYYDTMRKILPQKGISFTEIPRMMINGEVVSTSLVQKYLENEEYDKAFALVPESTKLFLLKQL